MRTLFSMRRSAHRPSIHRRCASIYTHNSLRMSEQIQQLTQRTLGHYSRRLLTRIEAAEHGSAELAASIAQHEHSSLSQTEATFSDLKRQQASFTKQLQVLEDKVTQAKKQAKEAQEAEHAASKSTNEWQERASALERQLDDIKRYSSESAQTLSTKLAQCNQSLKTSENELVKVRAEHAANVAKTEQLAMTREQKQQRDHATRCAALTEQLASLQSELHQARKAHKEEVAKFEIAAKTR
jgi:chromosome segregation ATPase